jgi:putative membrane protein
MRHAAYVETSTKAPINDDKKATEYLANERTFLAWIRTSIAVISLGFVVAKFSVWLKELAARLDPSIHTNGAGASLPIGIGMMAMGAILAGLAARRYHVVNLDIEKGHVTADRGLVIFVTLMVGPLSLAMIIYMIFTSKEP